MKQVCPLCNGMQILDENCPACGQPLVDGGTVSDYLGPYSPYMPIESLPFKSEGYCMHLIFCPACQTDLRVAQALLQV